MTVEDQIIRLPDAYAKDPDSVIYRLLHLNAADREEILAVLDQIQAWRSLDYAEGATLDLIGRDLNLSRGGMSDIEYRRRLRLRVATILSSGEIERLNEILDAFMGRAFLGLQEGWTDVAVWTRHFDGVQRFDTDLAFDAGDPCPLGPPEPAAVIVRCNLDALYEDIRDAFARAGSYTSGDILASIQDLMTVVAGATAGGVRMKWFPILEAFLEVCVMHAACQHLTVASGHSFRFDGSHSFNGSTHFDGGYSALRVNHAEPLAIEHRAISKPESRFDMGVPFSGDLVFDGARGLVVHSMSIIEVTV